MAVKVFIDGALFDESNARISVFDRGFLYGDSVYEAMRTAGGKPVDLEPHLERLHRSAAALALSVPSTADLENAIQRTLTAAGNDDSYVRLIVTRGGGAIGLDTALAEAPSCIVIVRPLVLPTAEQYEHGVALCIVEIRRTPRRAMDPSVKSGNYLNNIMALQEARKSGAYEALMCNMRGYVAEGSTSNVFIVRGGRLTTPPLETGLLAGITRQRISELAVAEGIVVEEAALLPEDVRGADEVFITSSVRGILPVTKIDDAPVGGGAVGAVTRRLMALYAAYLASYRRN